MFSLSFISFAGMAPQATVGTELAAVSVKTEVEPLCPIVDGSLFFKRLGQFCGNFHSAVSRFSNSSTLIFPWLLKRWSGFGSSSPGCLAYETLAKALCEFLQILFPGAHAVDALGVKAAVLED